MPTSLVPWTKQTSPAFCGERSRAWSSHIQSAWTWLSEAAWDPVLRPLHQAEIILVVRGVPLSRTGSLTLSLPACGVSCEPLGPEDKAGRGG